MPSASSYLPHFLSLAVLSNKMSKNVTWSLPEKLNGQSCLSHLLFRWLISVSESITDDLLADKIKQWQELEMSFLAFKLFPSSLLETPAAEERLTSLKLPSLQVHFYPSLCPIYSLSIWLLSSSSHFHFHFPSFCFPLFKQYRQPRLNQSTEPEPGV